MSNEPHTENGQQNAYDIAKEKVFKAIQKNCVGLNLFLPRHMTLSAYRITEEEDPNPNLSEQDRVKIQINLDGQGGRYNNEMIRLLAECLDDSVSGRNSPGAPVRQRTTGGCSGDNASLTFHGTATELAQMDVEMFSRHFRNHCTDVSAVAIAQC